MRLILIIAAAFALAGCVSVKEANIESATFNTAGWKSQAASGGEGQTIEATTTPTTTIPVAP